MQPPASDFLRAGFNLLLDTRPCRSRPHAGAALRARQRAHGPNERGPSRRSHRAHRTEIVPETPPEGEQAIRSVFATGQPLTGLPLGVPEQLRRRALKTEPAGNAQERHPLVAGAMRQRLTHPPPTRPGSADRHNRGQCGLGMPSDSSVRVRAGAFEPTGAQPAHQAEPANRVAIDVFRSMTATPAPWNS